MKMKLVISILLCLTIAAAIASDEHRPKMKIKDDTRGKRNLEYSVSHNHPIGSNFRLERRIASGPTIYQLPSRYPSFFQGPRPYTPNSKRGRPHSVPPPPYAVQMEPLVQYSQRDPLYDSSKLPLIVEGHSNDLSKPEDLLTDNNHLSENIYGPHSNHHHEPVYFQKEPEPIIEIIIKESNVTLPPVPVPTLPPKKKEPVQVFYVKYKKNPNGHGKDSVIYDKPVPAITPHIQEDDHEEVQVDQPHHEYVTASPPPSTTLRTIIRPDSETYIGTSGIHVTFGSEQKHHEKPSIEGHEESAPQPAVAFPQQAKFSQPIPDRKPPTFPPNFNSNGNFNQHSFGSPPQSHFQNNQYRPSFQQHQHTVKSFPLQQNNQQRPPNPPQRPFQNQQQFPPRFNNHQTPPQHRPPFNPQPQPFPPNHQFPNHNSQFPPNHQFPANHNPQFTQNHHFPPNHQNTQLSPNLRLPPNQFPPHSFQYNIPPHQATKPEFSHILNQRPQTHFPIIQQQLPQTLPPQQFNHKPINFNEQQQKQLQIQQQQQQQHNQQSRNSQHIQQQYQNQQLPIPNNHQNNFNFNQNPLNQPSHQQQSQQSHQQSQQQLSQSHFIPPGGELFKSVPRYEQHISVPTNPSNPQINNNQNSLSQSPPNNHNQQHNNEQFTNTQITSQSSSQNHQQNYQQQLQPQSLQLQQQQNLQIQQHEQISQQQKHLSPYDFHQQIQQQFQQFPQNFAQLSHVQNKQTSKPENNFNQQSQSPNYHQQNQQKSTQLNYQSQQNTPSIYQTSSNLPSTTQKIIYQSSTNHPTTTTTKPVEKSEEKKKEYKLPPNIQLPDEVPDELREQLLSSGILSNADISVLDYDKVGDIPIDALPPDQLANFYGAGGAQQLAASEQKKFIVKPNGEPVNEEHSKSIFDQELEAEASEIDETKQSPDPNQPVAMKVVHYDAETDQGKAVQDSYVRDDATQVDPVVLNDNKYNRYLPLKVSGAHFPIPDVPELKGRNITSVVVLAPVDYEFQPQGHHSERSARDIEGNLKDVRLLAGEALKEVLKEPTKENYNKWLERENQTVSDKQSVILLVTGTPDEKEIFMYDVGTKTVSKLSGELSSAFVEAAESNSDEDETSAASETYETKVQPEYISTDLEAENSEILEEFVDIYANSGATNNKILDNSELSKTG